jgi:hypothetical protein
MRSVAVLLAVAASLSACSAGGGTSGPRPQRNLITAEELAEVRVSTAYDAVQRLRSFWLTPLPASGADLTQRLPAAFLDNNVLGDLDTLRTIPLTDVQEIRYLEPGRAVMRFGTQYTGGIIQVITR